jgi:hypothetical protein
MRHRHAFASLEGRGALATRGVESNLAVPSSKRTLLISCNFDLNETRSGRFQTAARAAQEHVPD